MVGRIGGLSAAPVARRVQCSMQKVQKRETVPPVGRWGEREHGIIEVATQLYLQGGYENVTMAAVASAAGLSEGTLYNYFRDKQDLQLRVSLTAFEGHTQAAEEAVAKSKTLRDGLERLIAIELRMLIRAKELFLVWLREMRTTSGYPQSEARRMLRRFSSQLIRLFEKWKVAPDPAFGLSLPMARDIVFGSLEHIVWTARVHRREDQLDVETLSRDLASAYLRALGLDDAAGGAARKKERRPGRSRQAAGTRPIRRS
jgi:TetR/AcrR family transcriptional regulator, fatty acid metabolism regulator protein